jgi:porphobilinogen deaminase
VWAVNDSATWFCVHAEREFLRLLGGGCEVPIGVRASIQRPAQSAGEKTGEGEHSIGHQGGRQEQALLEAIVFEGDTVRAGSVAGEFDSAETAAQTLFSKIYGNKR